MRYPNFIEKGDTLGIIATSCGCNVNPYRIRCMNAIKNIEELGYKTKRGHRVFRMKNAVSAPHEIRAKDFMNMYKSKNVDFIWSTGGGEIQIGMLPFIDFKKISKLPSKFFMGFSDNTNLTFTLTTLADVATIYGCNVPAFGMNSRNVDVEDTFKLIKGEKLSFNSYEHYFGSLTKEELPADVLEEVTYKDENIWKSLNDKDNFEFKGRIIGGCLDVLVCLCGTKFDNVKNFIEKYKEDGFIWYFDVCDLHSCGLYRALFQLEQAGWFKYVKGFVVGRTLSSFEPFEYTFKQALEDVLIKYNVDVIYDADISHKKPLMPVINGSIATVSFKNGKGTISYELK